MTCDGRTALETSARAFTLAAALTGYPDDELGELLTDLAPELGRHEGAGPMVAALADGLAPLQARYIELFDRGKDRVSLYETEHGRMRGLAKGTDLADISGFYLAFGLTLDDDTRHEMLDHVTVELEFYAMLLLKQHTLLLACDAQGSEVVIDARRKFMADHLGRFVAAIAAQPRVAEDPVYGPVLRFCAAQVAAECTVLGVTPAPLDFFAVDREPETVDCGAVHLPVVD